MSKHISLKLMIFWCIKLVRVPFSQASFTIALKMDGYILNLILVLLLFNLILISLISVSYIYIYNQLYISTAWYTIKSLQFLPVSYWCCRAEIISGSCQTRFFHSLPLLLIGLLHQLRIQIMVVSISLCSNIIQCG